MSGLEAVVLSMLARYSGSVGISEITDALAGDLRHVPTERGRRTTVSNTLVSLARQGWVRKVSDSRPTLWVTQRSPAAASPEPR